MTAAAACGLPTCAMAVIVAAWCRGTAEAMLLAMLPCSPLQSKGAPQPNNPDVYLSYTPALKVYVAQVRLPAGRAGRSGWVAVGAWMSCRG